MIQHRIIEWLILLGVLVLGVLIGAFVLLPQAARAHEWYPSDCCSSTDCYEIDAADLEATMDEEGRPGWRVRRTGEFFALGQLSLSGKPRVRLTPPEAGGTWHRCSFRNGDPDAKTICLFVPPIGF